MSSPNPQMSMNAAAPLMQQAFRLEFPQSLGIFRDYAEVQRMVDALADAGFPVEHTMIVGTDLRLVERVTGRQSWGRVIGGGIMSGIWMGVFIGLLFWLIAGNFMQNMLTSILMGIMFFTVWAVIRYATTRGKRDFTSMAATVPMQFELLVEHRHFTDAKRLLGEAGIRLGVGAFGTGSASTAAHGGGATAGLGGVSAAGGTSPDGTTSTGGAAADSGAPSYGQSASGAPSYGQPASGAPSYGQPAPGTPTYGQPAPGTPTYGHPASNDDSRRPSYGVSTAVEPRRSQPDTDQPRRPQFGLPAEESPGTEGNDAGAGGQDGPDTDSRPQ